MKKTYKYHHISFILILISFLISCTDTVDVDVPNAGSRLVIEASINWEKGTSGQTQTIKLSESTGFFDSNTNVPVTGATVTVTKEDDGTEFIFQDLNNGNYLTSNFIPELNQEYSLEIQYNGQTYMARETLMSVSEINFVEQTIEGDLEEEEIQLKVFFDDPANINNFYLGEFIPSNLPLLTLTELDDEFTDGNENFIEYDNEDLAAGVTVDINLYGISQQYYNYISILIQQSGDPGIFATTPVQLRGNCMNPNNPDEEVLGYFRLGEVARTSYVIE
ncbi:MAG: DUF4249 domain-containing protein [Bacteroidota bacterium]